MSEPVQIALIVAVPPTVAALASIVVTWLSHRRANGKLDHITLLTNGTLTAAHARIAALEAVVETLMKEQGKQV